MIPRLKAYINISDLCQIISSESPYEDIRNFEAAFAQLAGQKHAVAFPYGRTAQIGIIKALGIGGAEIICPSYTCVVVPHAIVKSGQEPVFVDVAEGGYNMDWDLVEAATNENTGAVIATSLFGEPVNQGALSAYQVKHPDIPIIQDCAHSFFAHDIHKEGLAAYYGLNVSKIITSIFGGMVTTDDDYLAEKLREIRQEMVRPGGDLKTIKRGLYLIAVWLAFLPWVYGLVNRLERFGWLNAFVKYYDRSIIDLPNDAFEGMTGLEARMGSKQCKRYHKIVKHRRNLAAIYDAELERVDDLALPKKVKGHTYSHYAVQSPRAEQIKSYLLKKGVQLGALVDYEIPDMPIYKNFKYFGCHRSRAYPPRMINLPVHMGVSQQQARKIAELIREAV